MKVYRVVWDKTLTKGFYSGHGYENDRASLTYPFGGITGNHPLPDDDGMDTNQLTNSHIFGFESKESLDKWFYMIRDQLHKAGASIAVIELPEDSHILYGKSQIAFPKEDAQVVGWVSLLDDEKEY